MSLSVEEAIVNAIASARANEKLDIVAAVIGISVDRLSEIEAGSPMTFMEETILRVHLGEAL